MYALVTGASSGIGLRYAEALARDYHYDLLLVSNQEKELSEVAERLHTTYGVQTRWLYMNLAQADAAERIYSFCRENDLNVEVLINNAGMLIFEPFIVASSAKIQTITMLHVVTLTNLCRLFAPDMCERGKGYILNMSSMSAWMAMPGIQCYNATKGYVLNFSRALWYELRGRGVHVLAMTPGSTDTGMLPFPPTFAKLLRAVGITMSPEKLVRKALKALFRSKRKRYMPGAWNRIIVPIINHLPDWLVIAIMRRVPLFDPCFADKK